MEATSSSYEVPAETGYNYNGGSSDASEARAKHGNNKVGEGLARTKAVASTGVKKDEGKDIDVALRQLRRGSEVNPKHQKEK
ncbi:hypothetical protein RHGRI_024289 [Rhododendron griersonianum]|uniref:Uncharacterized protein n=1 Tax=Rhododendron griersonianum TaxID=479676 RepID=A0AAV6JB78_9ERIC|nr:hypothetical protein RHGRI_024289 [Rhododendron griersonianum]